MLAGPALHSDLRSVSALGLSLDNSSIRELNLNPGLRSDRRPGNIRILTRRRGRWRFRVKASSNGVAVEKSRDKRFSVCTADELHFVKAPNSDWSLALWRYLPSPEVICSYIYIYVYVHVIWLLMELK